MSAGEATPDGRPGPPDLSRPPERETPGLPPWERLRVYGIWDSYFTPSHSHPGADGSSRLLDDLDASRRAVELGCLQKLCYFPHVGLGTTRDEALEALLREEPERVMRPFDYWPGRLLGMIQVNPRRLADSIEALDRWLRDGPMVGAYFSGGGPGALVCTHPDVSRLYERVLELGGVVMQHTWQKTGGKGGPDESTPAELAGIAPRFPGGAIVCAHAGGEWEAGIRAVAGHENLWIETSGFDATAGFVEMGVHELGAGRILFGSHLPSRSLGTELCKVTAAGIGEEEKHAILGGNFRRLLGMEG